ncbi:MAG TPA: NAD(P)-binding domain-containing protein [Conexibacter sp.]|nr:NAD(P)-binding domain-containing protein [Conexibacter sp.]
MIILTESEIRSLVGHAEASEAVAAAFRALHAEAVAVPEPWHIGLGDGESEVHCKSAYVRGAASWSIKVSSTFYANHDDGKPALSGLIMLFDARTGVPSALLLDNGYLTELRTGAAGTLSVELLARPDARRVAVLGAGSQARYQLASLAGKRDVASVAVASRSRDGAERLASWWRQHHGCPIEICESVEAAVEHADIVFATTPASEPILAGACLAPGTHIVAVGADSLGKRELDRAVFERAAVVAVDHVGQATALGETRSALEDGAIQVQDLVTLGALVAGQAAGRVSPDQITVADLTGIGAQEAVLGERLLSAAKERGLGAEFVSPNVSLEGVVALPPFSSRG